MSVTFDSGFAVARLLRHGWFVDLLKQRGWQNGGLIMGVTHDTSIGEIRRCLKFYDPDTVVHLVLANDWLWVTQREVPTGKPPTQNVEVVRLVL